MPMRDLSSHLKLVPAIGAAVLNADNTPAAVNRQGHQTATLTLNVGIGGITFSGTNKIEFVLTHCDTEGGVYTPVAATDVLMPAGETLAAGGIIKSFVAAHAAAGAYKYGYIGAKKFLKLLADFSGTHGAGTPVAATWVFGQPFTTGV